MRTELIRLGYLGYLALAAVACASATGAAPHSSLDAKADTAAAEAPSAAAAPSAGASPGGSYDIDNSAKSFSMDGIEKTQVGYQYWFFDPKFAEGRTIKLSSVAPHQATHGPHRHEGHEFFFVLQGQAQFFLDGKTRVVGPQTALYCPPNSMHGISNAGDTELQYLVIKDYPWPPAP